MTLWGLHLLDVLIIACYIAAIIWIGKKLQERTRSTRDFYLAGRRLGKFYQFFLNFGNSTNADQAVAVSREIYRQGIGGMWIQYLVLFLTPFYWFTTAFFRRCRLITIGDYFAERFKSKFLAGAYAVFAIVLAVISGGVAYMVAAKTTMALTPKPIEKLAPAEKQSVILFKEYQELKSKIDYGLSIEERQHYEELNERYKKGELRAFVSYINPVVVYFIFAIVVAIYTILGGFFATAITDAIQGFLIITFSFLLIPLGLHKVGGFEGLHRAVPDFMFELFGSATLSEYAWYTVLAMVLANLVSIIAVVAGMQTAGSAKDEMTARFGMIGGMFFKRFIMLFWALTGLLAVALYAGQLHDPDLIWGHMTRDLLFPGGIGLMLAGILAAQMSSLDAGSVSYSALFVRNLYFPFYPGCSEKHYINVGRIVIVVTLLGGVGVALFVGNLLDLFKYFISIPAVFGASIWLGMIWRRVTKWAVIVQVFACIAVYVIIPNLFQTIDWTKRNPAFLIETKPREVSFTTKALEADVESGLAAFVGQQIQKRRTIEPTGIFFDKVARTDPSDPYSPKIGVGRFHAEIWVLSWVGIDFTRFKKAQLVATRFFFDAIFPFVLLFILSLLTKPVPRQDLDRFYAKIHTPIQPSPEKEREVLEESYRRPEKFEKDKIFPHSNWEIMKPGWKDVFGFGGSWVLVGVIIFLLWLLVRIQ